MYGCADGTSTTWLLKEAVLAMHEHVRTQNIISKLLVLFWGTPLSAMNVFTQVMLAKVRAVLPGRAPEAVSGNRLHFCYY